MMEMNNGKKEAAASEINSEAAENTLPEAADTAAEDTSPEGGAAPTPDKNSGTAGINLGAMIKKYAVDGILTNNPILIQVLGTCPTLATSTSVTNGVGMGLSATAVLAFSNLIISLLRRFIPKQVRIASYIVIISGFVTALEMLLKAYIPALDKSLGLFIPLIVVNCIILARAEAFASKNGPAASFLDGVFMGLGFTLALFILSTVRELIGAGTFAGIRIMPGAYTPALMIVLPAGAFISLGCVIAGFKVLAAKITK